MKNVIAMDESLFYHSIQDNAKPVLVEFMAPWCVYCRRIALAFDRLAQEYDGKVAFSTVNIDDLPDVADQENIEVVPTLVLYQSGKALGSIVAPDSRDKIEMLLREHLVR